MEITERTNNTTVSAVSTTADVSSAGRIGNPNPPGWKYTKNRSLRRDEKASNRAKAAINACVVIVLSRSSAIRDASCLKAANTSFNRGSSIDDTFYSSPPWK